MPAWRTDKIDDAAVERACRAAQMNRLQPPTSSCVKPPKIGIRGVIGVGGTNYLTGSLGTEYITYAH